MIQKPQTPPVYISYIKGQGLNKLQNLYLRNPIFAYILISPQV
ncbi:hypothetical protein RintRC_5658 [Richelia intracellularis]|nr:hypothetical protein RintRC_5658 [Richelia intracellularis]